MRRRHGAGAIVSGLLAWWLSAAGACGGQRAAAAPQAAAGAAKCTSSGCHAQVTQHQRVHGPAAAGRCQACHRPLPGATPFQPGVRHEFKRATGDPALCYTCHRRLAEQAYVHEPVRLGLCVLCHDPHGAERRFLLRVGTDQELCLQCHRGTPDRGAHAHGPVGLGACGACHDPHQSSNRFRLRAPGVEQCAACHQTELGSFLAARTVHAPVSENCGNCHEPHRGADRFRLVSRPPRLCLDCHQTIEQRWEAAAVKHAGLTTERACLACHDPHSSDQGRLLLRRPRAVCLKCHQALGELLAEATVTHGPVATERSCLACHDPHAGKVQRLLVQEPMKLCLSCHDRELDSAGGKLANIARHLAENPNWHAPIRSGSCVACHDPHGGTRLRMLVGSYPASRYAPFDEQRYGLCFGCHEVELVEQQRTAEATGFRNGDRNLHYVHVNRKVKGRTCRACHDVHASSRPKLIAETVPFGRWAMPIRYEKSANGGSCQPGCHRRRGYDRLRPVRNE